jgi:hypothetical protein
VFGALGVDRAMLSTDLGGIAAAVLRAIRTRGPKDGPWPAVEFCDADELTGTAADTTNAVRRMAGAGARVIVCLGGDGTARVAAAACGDVPLLPLSTGTNNAFPQLREATVAGMAVALVATGTVGITTHRASVLEVVAGDRTELALVDVCVSASRHVASRALWRPKLITELYCTFAEPDLDRARVVVRTPIAPGLLVPVGVGDWRVLRTGELVELGSGGVIALDGERELELRGDARDRAAARRRPALRRRQRRSPRSSAPRPAAHRTSGTGTR